MVAIVGVCFGYLFLLPYLGDLPAGAVAILLVLRVMGIRRWLRASAGAVALALVFHLVFVVLLAVPLPAGLFFG